jgi:hypothetical protein
MHFDGADTIAVFKLPKLLHLKEDFLPAYNHEPESTTKVVAIIITKNFFCILSRLLHKSIG